MDLLADLERRGLVHDTTDRAALAARIAEGPLTLYHGVDPTAPSLHHGNLIGLLMLRRFQDAGHRPIALAGGATGMIGDPGGRSEERNLLDLDTLATNVAAIKAQISRILGSEGAWTLVDNHTWTADLRLLDFLRDVGKHATVNQMMARDSVKVRMAGEHGISFTEFSYALLQANDFRHLYETHDVELQAGASDQWGNIVAGVDLIRRRLGKQAHAITHPLMTKSDGTKFGKSVGGSVWLDPTRTSPYQFSQFWMQSDDEMVATYLKMLSLREFEEIQALLADHEAAPERRVAQRALAMELTTMVHGAEAWEAATEATRVLFGGDPTTASPAAFAALASEVPTTKVGIADLADTIAIFARVGLATSNGDSRRTLQQKGFRANGIQLDANAQLTDVPLLHGRYLLLRKGKSNHHLVEISG